MTHEHRHHFGHPCSWAVLVSSVLQMLTLAVFMGVQNMTPCSQAMLAGKTHCMTILFANTTARVTNMAHLTQAMFTGVQNDTCVHVLPVNMALNTGSVYWP